jgi:hypothetical protein
LRLSNRPPSHVQGFQGAPPTRPRRGALLAEQIVKIDCDRCRLRTEHYVVDYGDRPAEDMC